MACQFFAVHDILDRSGGYELQAKLGKVFRNGPVYEPNLSVSYLDKDHVDYYYGVRAMKSQTQDRFIKVNQRSILRLVFQCQRRFS